VWREYIQPESRDEVLKILSAKREHARIVAGATDLILELERGVRRDIDTLIDVTRLRGLDDIRLDRDNTIRLGPLVTHNDCVASPLIRDRAFPLARAAWEVGAPQIRNRGTVAGNLITASPANDTITPLIALGATVSLASARGVRRIPLRDFYLGVRKTAMEPDEMLIEISFPAMSEGQRGTFIKLALRRAQAISVINVAIVLTLVEHRVEAAAIALGAVAPTIIRATAAEQYLTGRSLEASTIENAAGLTRDASRPIDDIRSSAAYRREMVRVMTARALRALRDKSERDGFPAAPVLLRGTATTHPPNTASAARMDGAASAARHSMGSPIDTVINGKSYRLSPSSGKSLLRLLREEAGLTGTKEGCAEGECGACTVFLDGEAVMSCLVPAPRAHNAQIVTIEGLAENGRLHPVQRAFVQDAAVQCGYCTPGFVMASAKLLEEKSNPTRNEIEQALTGNLCRCTGYYQIIKAVEDASLEAAQEVMHG
jgi:carbon-monoxide dehydrogenase medium subunit